jgi:hypothetical protein
MDLTVDRIKQEVAFRSSSLTILTTEETQLKLFENKTCSPIGLIEKTKDVILPGHF